MPKKKVAVKPVKQSPSSHKGLACLGIGCVGLILLALFAFVLIAIGIFLKVKSDPTFLTSMMMKYGGIAPSATPTPFMPFLTVTPTEMAVTPTPTAEPVTRENSGDYVLPFSSRERVLRVDLVGLTEWNLKVARNEIYARHGRPFVSKDLSCYFAGKSWYELDRAYSDARLTKLELENAVFILNFEKASGSTVYDRDTGCSYSR